ncbi:40196_t:CDS:2, partial [Gigaspora margarita]
MALFPLLQWLYRYDSLLTEVVPQFAYGVILLIIALLGVRSHWRFTRLLRITRSANSSQLSIVLKLEYFKEMNRYLTWGLFIGATSMIILCVDAFTPQKYINSHKFSQDLLFCHINFTIWIVFVSLCLIFYPSSNTLNDSLTMAKGIASSITDKSKGNFLGPPNSRFSKYNPNNEDSSWSSNGSSRNDRTSFYLDVHDDVSTRNNNQNRSSSRPTSVTFDIPPLPNSVTFDPLSPNPPPSVYNSSISRDPGNSSPFYFTSNTLLPSPALLPSTLSTEQQSSTNLPSSITITPEHSNISNISNNSNNNRRSLTFSKPLPTEPLQYPSSPLTKINRNSLSSLTSMENQFSTGISSPSHNQDISPLISSQSTRENSKDSLNSDDDLAYMSRKNARMSIISNNDKPIIKKKKKVTLLDVNQFTQINHGLNDNYNNSKILSSPTSPKYITDCTITPRSSSLIHAPRKVKTHNNLKTDVIDVVEMVKLNSPTFSNSSPKSPSPLLISPISPSSSSTTSSMSPTTPINDDSKNLLSSQLPIIPNSKTTTPSITTKVKS